MANGARAAGVQAAPWCRRATSWRGWIRRPVHDDPLRRWTRTGDASRAGFVAELMRKVAVAGLGALFMTEEGIRTLAGQLKLPKEVLGFILSQAEKTKDEVGPGPLRGGPPLPPVGQAARGASSSSSRG